MQTNEQIPKWNPGQTCLLPKWRDEAKATGGWRASKVAGVKFNVSYRIFIYFLIWLFNIDILERIPCGFQIHPTYPGETAEAWPPREALLHLRQQILRVADVKTGRIQLVRLTSRRWLPRLQIEQVHFQPYQPMFSLERDSHADFHPKHTRSAWKTSSSQPTRINCQSLDNQNKSKTY